MSAGRRLRVLIAGAHTAHAVGRSLFRGMRSLGHDTHYFNEEAWQGPASEALWSRAVRRALKPIATPAANLALLARALAVSPDLLVVLKGHGYFAETIAALRRAARAVVVFHTDDLQNRLNTSARMIAALPHWDVVFTPRRFALDELRASGARRAEHLPFGYDPELHFPDPGPDDAAAERLSREVVFLGTWAPDRAAMLESCAGRLPLAIHGTGWESVGAASPLRAVLGPRTRPLYGAEARRAITRAGINLAFLRKDNRDRHTMRTFEIPACGGFMLAERSDEHLAFFDEGREAAFFEGPAELLAQAARYIPDAAARRAIADAGRRRLLADRHTYADRAARIVEVAREVMR